MVSPPPRPFSLVSHPLPPFNPLSPRSLPLITLFSFIPLTFSLILFPSFPFSFRSSPYSITFLSPSLSPSLPSYPNPPPPCPPFLLTPFHLFPPTPSPPKSPSAPPIPTSLPRSRVSAAPGYIRRKDNVAHYLAGVDNKFTC